MVIHQSFLCSPSPHRSSVSCGCLSRLPRCSSGVCVYGEARTPRAAQARAMRWIEPSAAIGSVARMRSIAEGSGDVDHPYRDRSQPFGAKHLHEWLWLADGEALPLIQGRGGRIERHGSVPEVSHQLHLASIVPDIRRNATVPPTRATRCISATARLGCGTKLSASPATTAS